MTIRAVEMQHPFIYFHRYLPGEPALCPVCDLPGGFHESTVHSAKREIHPFLLKEAGWHKRA